MGLSSSTITVPPGRVRIGCSGWQYRHWRGSFYPRDLAVSRWFAHYALAFDTVEINNSFYRLPEAATFERWREAAPPRFVYAVKASRFLTHMKKLSEPEDPLRRFLGNAAALNGHLGPVLYQLPPRWPLNLDRLEIFLQSLSTVGARLSSPIRRRLRHTIEFRDPTWYDDRVFALLDRHRVALCLHDMHGSATGRLDVGPFVYARFHVGEQKYGGGYDDERLAQWGEWLSARARDGVDVFAYFNNDIGGHAPRDALRLRSFVQRRLAA